MTTNMSQKFQQNHVGGSRLVRLLSDYVSSNSEISHKHFAERLGLLIDLSDSVILSESLRGLARVSFEATGCNRDESEFAVQEEYLKQRSIILKFILKSFDPKAVLLQFKLPIPKADASIEDAISFDPYLRFYGLHQSELDFKIEKLRYGVRQEISAYSLRLAQLAELDKTLGKSLATHTRKRFAVVPKILKQRFEFLLLEHQTRSRGETKQDKPIFWLESGGWLTKFYYEMQQLLLAELEIRLQPVLGLVEAFNEEVDRKR